MWRFAGQIVFTIFVSAITLAFVSYGQAYLQDTVPTR